MAGAECVKCALGALPDVQADQLGRLIAGAEARSGQLVVSDPARSDRPADVAVLPLLVTALPGVVLLLVLPMVLLAAATAFPVVVATSPLARAVRRRRRGQRRV